VPLTDCLYSPKQYKDRITKWGLEKKIKTAEMEAIIRKQQERALQGKRSAFLVRNKPVDSKKIARYIKVHSIPALNANEDMNMDRSMDVAGKIDFFASDFFRGRNLTHFRIHSYS
jgi:hypothetical protein